MKTLRIVNGLVVDGTGRPAFNGEVVMEGDRISAVEPAQPLVDPPPDAVDAAGCVVSPGFIDSHSHSDAYLVLEPDAPSKLSQGVTTEVNGQCGGSVAPRYGEARLSGDWATLLGERLVWRSFAEYRTALSAARPSINTVQFIGHNTLRSSVIGYAGVRATPDSLKAMQNLLARELDDGAWGLTTGLIYQPGKYADSAEVVALARTVAEKGGFYATHMCSEGDRILEAIDEVVDLVRATGIRAEISHLKTSGWRNWHKIDAVLDRIASAVDAGLLLGSDRYPFCAAGTDLDIVLPDWAQEGAAPAECARLADPAIRSRIVAEIDASGRDWQTVRIGGTWSELTRPMSGRTIAEIAGSPEDFGLPAGMSPGELVCRILETDRCLTGGFFFGMSEANMRRILACPWIVPGSDASLRAPWGPLGKDHPHPRAYGTMPSFFRLLTGRDTFADGSSAEGSRLDFSLEEAVARMTSVPARRFCIQGRGVLERGAFADIAIWRPEQFRNASTYDRPHAFCTGMCKVFVNGALAYSDGEFTHAGTGRFLDPQR